MEVISLPDKNHSLQHIIPFDYLALDLHFFLRQRHPKTADRIVSRKRCRRVLPAIVGWSYVEYQRDVGYDCGT